MMLNAACLALSITLSPVAGVAESLELGSPGGNLGAKSQLVEGVPRWEVELDDERILELGRLVWPATSS